MSEVIKRLNDTERSRLDAQVTAIARAPAPQVDARSGKQFVFVAHFDGTNNDKHDLKLSGNPLPTNVAELWSQMKPLETGNPNLKTQYYPGVGTDPGAKGAADVLLPSAEMKATALEAYRDFEKTASDWLRAHPEANPAESLQVMATGFSRGGGTAAIFSQLLFEKGLSDPKTGKTLVPPGQQGLTGALIYDPVTTGYDGNSAFSPASKNITVVQAQNEYRILFRGVDHSGHPGVTVVPVTGNHCNIGGGYDRGIGAQVLQASNKWFQKAGMPLTELPQGKCPDGSATVYHERDLPHVEKVASAGRHPLARVVSPLGSRMLEGAAEVADYPVTHDPRNGLHARRELDPAARGERQRADGWRRFSGAEGTIWRKDYVSDKGVPLSAVVVERDLPGTANDRIDLYLNRRDGQRELLMEKTRLPAQGGPALRESLDRRFDPAARDRADAATHAPSDDQRRDADRFKAQLGPRLAQQGMNDRQIDTLAAMAAKEGTRYSRQGEVSQFLINKDGNRIVMRQDAPPLREFSVAEALALGSAKHWREVVALNRDTYAAAHNEHGDPGTGLPRVGDPAPEGRMLA